MSSTNTLFKKTHDAFTWCRTVVPMQKRNTFVVYGIILIASALDNLNSASALTMSESIQIAFDTNSSTTSWVLSGYALTLGSFIMISGKIADVIGPHNIYLIGLTIIWICALIIACLPHTSIVALIVFRALQGIGASALIPSMIALTANYFTGDKAQYLVPAILSMIVTLTATLGLGIILGGAFSLTSIGYRSFFYFVFALSFVCKVLLLFLIIPIERTEGHNNLKLKNIDYLGAFLVIVGTLLMILGLTEGGEGWRSAKAIAPLLVGFFTVSLALIFEGIYIKRFKDKHKSQDPESDWRLRLDLMFPPELLKIPNFLVFLIVSGIYYATFIMLIAVGVQYYIYIEHNSPLIASLKVFPLSVGLVFGAAVYREYYYKKIGFKNMFILSGVLSLCGIIWDSRTNFTVNNSYWKYGFVSLFMYGYGINMYFNIYIKVVIDNTPLHLQGVVNGIYQTVSQVVLAVGNALVPSIIGNIGIAYTEIEKKALHNKFQPVYYVIMGFQAFALITMTIFLKNTEPEKKEEKEEERVKFEQKDPETPENYINNQSNPAPFDKSESFEISVDDETKRDECNYTLCERTLSSEFTASVT